MTVRVILETIRVMLRNLRHEERSSVVNLCLLITGEPLLRGKIKHIFGILNRYIWLPNPFNLSNV